MAEVVRDNTPDRKDPAITSPEALSESTIHPDPLVQFERWMSDAVAANLALPNAMILATATRDGQPSARAVLLKGVDERGFIFYTNYESRKARELAENPRAALVFYWPELRRQVRITGSVAKVSREESEAYSSSRPTGSRLGAWASRQSEVIASREALDDRLREVAAAFPGDDVPVPPFWGGYVLSPCTIEFWQSRPNRLHDRLRYSRQADGRWLIERLQP